MTLRWGYLAVALALLVTELLIALFVNDRFVRPYLGDVLAVVLVYAGLCGITRLSPWQAAAIALAIAFAIELAQLAHVLDRFGMTHNRVLRVLFGSKFEFRDLLCYVVGALAALGVERLRTPNTTTP